MFKQNLKTIYNSTSSNYFYYIHIFLYYLIVIVLLISGLTKIINPEGFIETLNTTLSFLNENIIGLIALCLPLFEVTLSVLLLFKIKIKIVLTGILILFSLFLVYAIYGTIAGYNDDCGCFGEYIKSQFGIGMIIRNSFLTLITIITLLNLKKFDTIKFNEKLH